MKIPAACFVLVFLPFVLACEEEETPVGFELTSGVAAEGDGVQKISIHLGKVATSSITITYVVGGTASLDGDYKLISNTNYSLSSMSLVVKEGESNGSLTFELIDDSHLEPRNETIYFEITGISDVELNAALQHRQFSFEIQDNDTSPADGMQVDLSWNVGEGISINAANFDLYLARQVVISNNEMVDFELVQQMSSTNPAGFESFVVNRETADEVYYIIIRFVAGTMNSDVFLHMSQGVNYGFASGKVSTNSVGKDLYYGPITKNGNNFRFR